MAHAYVFGGVDRIENAKMSMLERGIRARILRYISDRTQDDAFCSAGEHLKQIVGYSAAPSRAGAATNLVQNAERWSKVAPSPHISPI